MAVFCQLQNGKYMVFNFFQILLLKKMEILFCHETAFSRYSIDKAVFFQFIIGSFGSDNADTQVFGEIADRRQRRVSRKCAVDDVGFYLRINLCIYGLTAVVVNEYMDSITFLYTVYKQYIQ